MPTGIVKFFNPIEGFGLIMPDDRGKDVVVLGSAVERAGSSSLMSGQKIAYDLYQDRKSGGVVAHNLHIERLLGPG